MKVENIQYVRILLTKRCNLSCAFCHQEGCDFSNNEIDFDLLLMTVQMLYDIGYRKIKLMGGEPMLYSRIYEATKAIRNIGTDIDLSMVSNGSAPVEKYLNLFECGLDRLNISVHGWDDEFFCLNTGNTVNLCKKIKTNIIFLAKLGKINKINYVLQKKKNEKDFYQLIEDVKDLNIVVDVLNLLSFPGQEDIDKLKYNFSEIENLISEYWIIDNILEYDNPYSLPSKRVFLKNGCVLNLKESYLNEQDVFYSCVECKYKDLCVEGIKAIRLTNEGLIQPCLLRTDNTFNLDKNNDKQKVLEYLTKL